MVVEAPQSCDGIGGLKTVLLRRVGFDLAASAVMRSQVRVVWQDPEGDSGKNDPGVDAFKTRPLSHVCARRKSGATLLAKLLVPGRVLDIMFVGLRRHDW